MIRIRFSAAVVLMAVTSIGLTSAAVADDTDHVVAIVDRYVATETELAEQAKLMTDDRTIIVAGARFTDNVANMRGQLAGEKLREELDPDGVMIVTIEDPLVRAYGDAAVASFYRHWTWVPGAAAVRSGNAGNPPPSQVVTLVLNKVRGDWTIVHTQISPMGG